MISNRVFRLALMVSLSIHGIMFLHWQSLNPLLPKPKNQKIEVNYVKVEPKIVLSSKSVQDQQDRSLTKIEPFLKLDASVVTGSRVPPPYVQPANLFKDVKELSNKPAEFSKPTFSSPDVLMLKKKITLPEIEMAKIDNPSYINYYQIVREKIRRSAYQNYSRNETGEAYVSFIISNDGDIKNIHLVNEKSTAGDYLKDIALSSVKDASPFPNFPKELDYPQLSFNIIISFEIE